MHPLFLYFLNPDQVTKINFIKLPLVITAFSCLLFLQPLYAEPVEYKIKAGYLYNFTKFITWPEDKSATFNLCILGDDPFGVLIDPIEQRRAFDKPIKLFRLENSYELLVISKTSPCHILFVSSSVLTLPSNHQAKNVLVVGESENFARNGGMVGFVNENSRIKLQINRKAFQESELKVSAKLMEVSELIDGDNHD